MQKIFALDCNNLIHIEFHTNGGFSKGEDAIDMALAQFIIRLSYLKTSNPDARMILCFDSAGLNWRLRFTKSEDSVGHRIYKANRKKKLSPSERKTKQLLDTRISELSSTLKKYTKLDILQAEEIEGDDFIAGICHVYGNDPNTEITIVSSDKDYIQLLRYPNVNIMNPLKSNIKRDLSAYNNDADLFVFEKCIRGDPKDNVRSSYPRLTRKKLVEAFYDPYKMENLMQHEFEEVVFDENSGEYITIKHKVRELFEENKMLLDLNCQPEEIKEQIYREIREELFREKRLNLAYLIRYFGKHQLNNLVKSINKLKPLFENKT